MNDVEMAKLSNFQFVLMFAVMIVARVFYVTWPFLLMAAVFGLMAVVAYLGSPVWGFATLGMCVVLALGLRYHFSKVADLEERLTNKDEMMAWASKRILKLEKERPPLKLADVLRDKSRAVDIRLEDSDD